MKYRIIKETKPHLPTCGKYKAVAVHPYTIDSRQIAEEVAKGTSLSVGDVHAFMSRISEVVNRHLRQGVKVRLKDLGMLKLEIESEKVDAPEDFKPRRHIRGVRLHFLPESSGGSPELYQNMKYERER